MNTFILTIHKCYYVKNLTQNYLISLSDTSTSLEYYLLNLQKQKEKIVASNSNTTSAPIPIITGQVPNSSLFTLQSSSYSCETVPFKTIQSGPGTIEIVRFPSSHFPFIFTMSSNGSHILHAYLVRQRNVYLHSALSINMGQPSFSFLSQMKTISVEKCWDPSRSHGAPSLY